MFINIKKKKNRPFISYLKYASFILMHLVVILIMHFNFLHQRVGEEIENDI